MAMPGARAWAQEAKTAKGELAPLNRFSRMVQEWFVEQAREAEEQIKQRLAALKTKEDAQKLADAMKSVGESMKVKTSYLLNPMDEPLGRNVGNALEIAECVEILQGGGPKDLIKLIVDLAEKVSETPRAELEKRLKDGSAWNKFTSLVYAQDGDATTLEKLLEHHRAAIIEPWSAKSAGTSRNDPGANGFAWPLTGPSSFRAMARW